MDEESKQSLELYRLKQWGDQINGAWSEMQEIQKQSEALGQRAAMLQNMICMSILEVEDQRGTLRKMGITDEEMDRVAEIPKLPFQPKQILRRARGPQEPPTPAPPPTAKD